MNPDTESEEHQELTGAPPAGDGLHEWSTPKYTGQPPRHRSLHVLVLVGDALYIFGGYDGQNRVADFHKFDFNTGTWTLLPNQTVKPSARDRHVAVAHSNCIYVFGGYDGSNRINDLWQYDTDMERWAIVEGSGQAPTPRHSHSGVEHSRSLYIFAGYDGNYRSDLHEFHLGRQKWSLVPAKGHGPKARYRTSAVVHHNRMLVFGGHDGAKHLNDFYELNFDTLNWSAVEPSPMSKVLPPTPRDSHIAVIHGESMFLFGGSIGTARNDLYEFRLDTCTWNEFRPDARGGARTPCPRFCHTGCVYKSSLYVFGGYDGQNRLNDFRRFKLDDEVVHVEIPPSSLIPDLRTFLNDRRFSDVTFIVEGEPVYAHKLLCLRCSYFRAMFEGQMLEASMKEIVINHVQKSVFLAVLEFLYTDEMEIKLDMAMDLFVAADQFGVERLKKMCEKAILQSITVESAASILQAADMHSARSLRQRCLDFILRHFDSVSKTSAFEEMGRRNVELLFEILKRR